MRYYYTLILLFLCSISFGQKSSCPKITVNIKLLDTGLPRYDNMSSVNVLIVTNFYICTNSYRQQHLIILPVKGPVSAPQSVHKDSDYVIVQAIAGEQVTNGNEVKISQDGPFKLLAGDQCLLMKSDSLLSYEYQHGNVSGSMRLEPQFKTTQICVDSVITIPVHIIYQMASAVETTNKPIVRYRNIEMVVDEKSFQAYKKIFNMKHQ